ncbi:MAG: ZIP family metal transporter, partial [Erysipelotrichaceae bacterium]|nr:ZIP family metal transporter [Erysipelotrichaceae bacterium]
MGVSLAVLIPFIGTSLGAAAVFLLRNSMSDKLEKILLGFASGVMVAASVWSLIIPSLEMSVGKWRLSWFPASVGIMGGILFLLLLDSVIPHLHVKSDEPEGIRSTKIKKTMMMVLAVTLHNIPEGMAVGVVLAGALSSGTNISMASAFALSVGIAIQNIPEGAIISMPLKSESLSKG